MEIFENFSRSRLKSNRLRDTAKLVGTGTYVKFFSYRLPIFFVYLKIIYIVSILP